MKKSKQAFSIIEVLTASIILSIAVFGVFKLISENTKIINNSDNFNTANSLFLSFEECIENKKTESKIFNNQSFYMGLNNCSVANSDTGIIINNMEYTLYGSGTGDNTFDLYIKNDSLNLKQKYILK